MSEGDWSQGEVVRNVQNLTRAVEKLHELLASLDTKYVPREVQVLRDDHIDSRLMQLGSAIADLEANAARHEREHADGSAATWRGWVVPVVTGIVVAAATVLFTYVAGVR